MDQCQTREGMPQEELNVQHLSQHLDEGREDLPDLETAQS